MLEQCVCKESMEFFGFLYIAIVDLFNSNYIIIIYKKRQLLTEQELICVALFFNKGKDKFLLKILKNLAQPSSTQNLLVFTKKGVFGAVFALVIVILVAPETEEFLRSLTMAKSKTIRPALEQKR